MKNLSESASQIEKTNGCRVAELADVMELPVFDGTNPRGWLPKVVRFFSIGRYTDEEKLDLVFLSLDGAALKWFLREMSTLKFRDWTAFEHRLLARFDPEIVSVNESRSDHVSPQIEEFQVPVTHLEPSLRFCSASLVICEESMCAIVKNNQEYSLFDHENLPEIQEAHKVFDTMFHRGHKHQRGKKSLSFKFWLFKYKRKCRLLDRFGEFIASKPRSRLLTINQTAPIPVYVSTYEELSSHVTRLEFEKFEYIYSQELQPEILIVETFGGLWVLSIIGSCCNFLTLFYIATVLVFTIPVVYEKYEDKVDAYGEKAMKEIKKQYAVLDEKVLSKVLSKIPRGASNKKKD